MKSIEISIGNQKYILRGDQEEEHLKDVAELVRRKIEALKKQSPQLSLQKISMLAAFDFASQLIEGKKKSLEGRAEIVARASHLLEKIESELASH